MSAPVSTVVIALDVPATTGAGVDALAKFEDLIVSEARHLGSVVRDQGGMALTLTLSPETAPVGALRRVASFLAGFGAHCAPLKVRAVVHYGVVFRTESDGQSVYMGSAIRSAQSSLRRAPADVGLAATREFAAYAAGLPASTMAIDAYGGGSATDDGLSVIRFGDVVAPAPRKAEGRPLASADPELLQFLKKRLATDLGPFASALVDNARRSAATASQLVSEVSREIDDTSARRRFEADVQAYLKSRS